MLDLRQTYLGSPSSSLHHLVLPHETLLLYPSADAVIILNARNLALLHVLAFWEVFPGMTYTSGNISCISVDSGMKLIVAAMNHIIATWSLSGVRSVQNDTWRIHSSLNIPRNCVVTTLDSKSGLLAVGTNRGLSVYTLILEDNLPTWFLKWTVSLKTPPLLVRFAPSLMYIATTNKIGNAVCLYSTTTGRQIQSIPHPRPVTNLSWRHSQASSRGDLILYTVTSDSTLRIYFPVLDSPQYLQLHAAIDLYSSIPSSFTVNLARTPSSAVFWLDREVIIQTLEKVLNRGSELDDVKTRTLQDIQEEGWDLFLRVIEDGGLVLTAVANIDRRPPTLLKHFVIQQTSRSPLPGIPSHLYALPNPSEPTISLVSTPPLCSSELDLTNFFDDKPTSLKLTTRFLNRVPAEESEIDRFVRTPEGRGVGVIRKGGGGETWSHSPIESELSRSVSWGDADQVVVLDHGRLCATYSSLESILTLHTSPPTSISIPRLISLFTTPSSNSHDSILGVTADLAIVHLTVKAETAEDEHSPSVKLSLHSQHHLPLDVHPCLILPVDPMAWGMKNGWVEHDALLSISEEGELAFWIPEDRQITNSLSISNHDQSGWRCTGKVKTGRRHIRKARCSSAKKTALITPCSGGEELTIWDSKESEFASGLEFSYAYSQPINDLDWTSTPDMQSILAVGFLHHVELLCQQRMTYFDEGPGWSVCWKIDIGSFTPYPINDSIWLANSSLLIGAGHQMLLYGPPKSSEPKSSDTESLFEYVARQNGPLPDYHPQMLLQCLLWEKIELVKEIIVNLGKDLESIHSRNSWASVPVERFFSKNQSKIAHKKRYNMLFDGPQEDDEEDSFCRPFVTELIELLESRPLPRLTPNECASLIVLIQTTLEIDEQRRALDSNGLRYLISMRSFYIVNRRASTPASPRSSEAVPRNTGRRERLRYRDMVWAFHSESQDLLLGASSAACNGKMGWSDARALGISVWLNSIESLKAQMEVIARNEYMAGDIRDPTACSLLYFALGKTKLVHGLWRQAAWHKEQSVMLKFLSNDFSQSRWRTAALKNAFALLSKQRFEYAAAFFLLGGSLKDAVNVCIKQLHDFQLAIAIARVVEQSNEGPVFCGILNSTVLPTAFREGNRWLASWAFWLLHRRDLGVRILVTPLQELASILDVVVKDIGEPHYDDPSLALLFSQLRSKTLQAAKGNSEISGRLEFNFVLQIARVFCRMGCHILALDLVQSWSFDKPTALPRSLPPQNGDISSQPSSPTTARRSTFSLVPSLHRRSSIMIDMDIPSLPPTRAVSPEGKLRKQPVIQEDSAPDEGDLDAKKAGLGSLMKSAKQVIQVPDFDMSAFNF
ncbi:RAVE protein 1 C terminal-domain-containing protein [Lentinula aciculospora]|uniref:RAVE protein 1 C terminal-domain-containing protein n=1 Tax=Lentinula aciculospora TaxID=153920 RepID=A0A9W9DUP4_9AGAR|nr:RAVE protein 1 C terminal-domain-containing protein [Lentinula aciculospora]